MQNFVLILPLTSFIFPHNLLYLGITELVEVMKLYILYFICTLDSGLWILISDDLSIWVFEMKWNEMKWNEIDILFERLNDWTIVGCEFDWNFILQLMYFVWGIEPLFPSNFCIHKEKDLDTNIFNVTDFCIQNTIFTYFRQFSCLYTKSCYI